MKKFVTKFLAVLLVTFYLGAFTPQSSQAYYVDENGQAWSNSSDYQYDSYASDPYYSEPSYDQYQYGSVFQEAPQIDRVSAANSLGQYINQAAGVTNAYAGWYGNPPDIRNDELYQAMIWIGRSENDSYNQGITYDQGVASDALTVATYARGASGETYSPLTGQQMYEILGASYTMSNYYTANGEVQSDQEYLDMLGDYTNRALGR